MHRVEISNTGDTTFQVTAGDAQLTIGTEGKSITAIDSFLASLGACVGFYMRLYCSTNNIPLGKFNVAVQAELTESRPYHFRAIDIAVGFADQSIDEPVRKELVEFVKSCPLYTTLTASPKIDIRIE